MSKIFAQGLVCPLDKNNVDTDQIIPKQFLTSVSRDGFAEAMFYDWRYLADGSPNPEFVVNKPQYQGASILLTRANFGCGSSREHAPWAIADLGYRCIIAPTFADIFAGNCVKNGILTVELPQDAVDALVLAAEGGQVINVDLEEQVVVCGNARYEFDYNAEHKEMLMQGLDEIGQTLTAKAAISNFEARQQRMTPWLYRH